MSNRFFDAGMLRVLLRPWAWKLVAAGLPPEVRPVAAPRRRGWSIRHAHSHPHPEVLICLRGRSHYGAGPELFPCRPGVVFFFDAFERHDCDYPPGAPDCDHLWISIVQDRVIARLITCRHGRLLAPAQSKCLLMPDECGVLFHAVLPPAAGGWVPPAVARQRLLAAVAAVAAGVVAAGYNPDLSRDPAAAQLKKMETIRRHIAQTAGRGASLKTLAELAGYSKYHFLRLFKRHFGRTVHQFINDCRLGRVGQMLARGCLRKTIAAELGFSGAAAFSRWRRKCGPEGALKRSGKKVCFRKRLPR